MYIEMNAADEVSKFNEAEQLEKFVSLSVCFEFNFEPSLLGINSFWLDQRSSFLYSIIIILFV